MDVKLILTFVDAVDWTHFNATRVVRLAAIEGSEADLLTYLNRLSDLLFTLARLENQRNGTGDIEWVKHPQP